MNEFLPVEVMWRVALAAVPLALLVAVLNKTVPSRPATRHLLWVGVVLILIATPFLPALDVPDAPALRQTAGDLVARAAHLLPPAPAPAPGNSAATIEPTAPASDETISTPATAPPALRAQPALSPAASAAPDALPIFDTPQPFPAHVVGETIRDHTESDLRDLVAWQPPSARQSDTMSAAFFESPRDAAAPSETRSPALDREFDRSFVLSDAFSSLTEKARSGESRFAPTSAPPASFPPPDRIGSQIDPKIGALSTGSTKGSPEPRTLPPAQAQPRSDWRQWLATLVILRDAIIALPPMPAAVWIGGIALILLIVSLRLGESMRLIRLARPAPDWVVEEVDAAARELKLRRMPEPLMVDARVSPMVWCGRQPRLILPRRLWDQLDEDGRAAVLYHELAHLRRRDHWVSWADLAAGILYWWHPVVWWIRRRIREEADLSCDAWVTALMPQGRRAYAQALLETKKYTSACAPFAAVAAPGVVGLGVSTLRAKAFARRITMVMTEQKTPGLSMRGVLLAALLVMAGCIVTPIWACPPDAKDKAKDKPAKVEPAKTIRVIAPSTRPDKKSADDKSTFERYMNQHDEAGDDDGDADGPQSVHVIAAPEPPHAPEAPSVVRITTNGSRSCCNNDCCSGCQCGGEVRVTNGAIEALVSGNVHAHIISNGHVYCTAKGDCPAKTIDCSETDTPIAVAQAVGTVSPGTLGAVVGGSGVTISAPNTVTVAESVGTAARVISVASADDDDDSDEQISRMYTLPQGKLQDLTRLMARDDVPVLIRRHDDGIEVLGTARQQAIFRAFVNMINPEGAAANGGDDDDIVVIEVDDDADVEWGDDEDADHADARAEDRARAEAEWHRAMEMRHGEIDRRREQANREMERRHQEIERQREQTTQEFERQVQQIERERQRLEERAQRLGERAESYRAKAAEYAEKAESARNEADDQDNDDRANRLRDRANQYEQRAADYEARADQCEAESEAMHDQHEGLQDQIEAVHEQAEMSQEQFQDAIEQLQEELEAVMQQIEQEAAQLEEQAQQRDRDRDSAR